MKTRQNRCWCKIAPNIQDELMGVMIKSMFNDTLNKWIRLGLNFDWRRLATPANVRLTWDGKDKVSDKVLDE